MHFGVVIEYCEMAENFAQYSFLSIRMHSLLHEEEVWVLISPLIWFFIAILIMGILNVFLNTKKLKYSLFSLAFLISDNLFKLQIFLQQKHWWSMFRAVHNRCNVQCNITPSTPFRKGRGPKMGKLDFNRGLPTPQCTAHPCQATQVCAAQGSDFVPILDPLLWHNRT